jgi:hypothetical protein
MALHSIVFFFLHLNSIAFVQLHCITLLSSYE